MRLRQIEVFHAIYTTGSISAAARALHVSQPSVSKVLHHTQYQLGFELFTLVRGRLVATDEAHALFVEVKDIFERTASLRKTVANLRNGGGGHIRLAVVPSLGLYVAPRAIALFRRRHPQVTFDVQTLHHDDLFRALYERECDIAFAYNPPQHPRMQRRTLDHGQLMLLYRHSEMPDPGPSVPIAWLDGRDLVGLASSGPIADLLDGELERQGVNIHEVVSNQTYYLAAALTRCGAGMTVVDEFTARVSADERVGFRPIDPAITFRIECVHLEDRPPSRTAEQFIELFTATLREVRQAGARNDA
ncbi:LysR family transcriptional regulator [Pseudoxanthomonas broegbernensis]|uniref:LysR family transcriptional regulator n=1 Tax=Pseudoxanthomonas broegbernensis TaxID=83619 RepID=A0A7V8GK99_9GAMM|nr:LysR family transcriptional regulator [Pseudoxanthomonas broegbernensis]KAF1684934.1 LysR family transcriptional regulator [Pseudoxanthomonas broegbernensis]MBB6066305.1 DNA-binding transcriptional LysR family regulator [Pseudoxanthomonas broegbernensis]